MVVCNWTPTPIDLTICHWFVILPLTLLSTLVILVVLTVVESLLLYFQLLRLSEYLVFQHLFLSLQFLHLFFALGSATLTRLEHIFLLECVEVLHVSILLLVTFPEVTLV